MTRAYLEREPIQHVEYTIEQGSVKVESPSTTYIQFTLNRVLVAEQITTVLNEVYTLSKDLNVKLDGKTKTLRVIRENYPKYLAIYHKINGQLEALKIIVSLIEDRGLHAGTNDDELLEAASRIVEKMCEWRTVPAYRNIVLQFARIQEVAKTLKNHHHLQLYKSGLQKIESISLTAL